MRESVTYSRFLSRPHAKQPLYPQLLFAFGAGRGPAFKDWALAFGAWRGGAGGGGGGGEGESVDEGWRLGGVVRLEVEGEGG